MRDAMILVGVIVFGIGFCLGFALLFDSQLASEVGDLVTGWLE